MENTPSLIIYLAAAIAAGRSNPEDVNEILRAIRRLGHTVAIEKIGLPHGGETEDEYARFVFAHDRKKLDAADAMVAEVSTPSLGVGWEIAYCSLVRQRPVFCFYRSDVAERVSAMILGNDSPLVRCAAYGPQGIEAAVREAVAFFTEKLV